MTRDPKPPAKAPCKSCPYRCDVPSGVWAEEEYVKLPPYDNPTGEQPLSVFMCHQQDGRICAGWAGCHDMGNSLAIRLAGDRIPQEVLIEVLNYQTDTPLFASGAEAAAHGLALLGDPDAKARAAITRLLIKRDKRKEEV